MNLIGWRYQWKAVLIVLAMTLKGFEATVFECDFENDACGFVQIRSWGTGLNQDHKDWTRKTGPSGSRYTGPSGDHTSGSGYYMMYDTMAFQSFRARATIYKQLTIPNQHVWMRFYYHIFGFPGMGGLTVNVNSAQVLRIYGNQGNAWKKAEVKLNTVGSVKIYFIGYKDGSHYGDIAIDDILVTEYYQPNATELTVIQNEVCLNDYVELNCTTNGYPESAFSYYLDDVLIRKFNTGQQRMQSTAVGNATYRCLPSNVVGEGRNATIAVTTHGLPIVSSTASQDVIENTKFTLVCNATGKEPLTFLWKKVGGTTYPASGKNHTFQNIQSIDRGSYECTVTDGNGCSKTSQRTNLNILYLPRNTRFYATGGSSSVCLYNLVTLRCDTDANPRAHEYQIKLRGELVETSNYKVVRVNATTAGLLNYSCSPFNSVGEGENSSVLVTSKVPTKVEGITENQTNVEGSRVFLECNVTGDEPISISWKKDGLPFITNRQNITIVNVTITDKGAYECIASNGNECPSARSPLAYVHILYKPRDSRLAVSNTTICLKDTIYLECTSNAEPPAHEYLFYENDLLIRVSSIHRIQINVTTKGNNTYKCQARNTIGLGENATVFVNTKAPPNITWFSPNQSVVEGSNVLLLCNVTGYEPMDIVWSKVGVLNSSFPVGHGLAIHSITAADNGTYKCTATNGNECPVKSASTYINVLYQPHITAPSQPAVTLYHNNQLDLNCKADGNPVPNVTWTRDSLVIGTGRNMVLAAEQSEPGIYTCTASNGIGVNAKANVNVVVKVCENVCQYNKSCVRQGTTFRCVCRRGLTGAKCEKQDPEGTKVFIEMTLIEIVWNDEYTDSTSSSFKSLEEKICNEIQKPFSKTMIKCTLIKASKGSIITETELTFNETKTQSSVEETLREVIVNNTLGSLKLDPSTPFEVVMKQNNMCECQFDGECTVQGESYRCDCKLFRYGIHCEKGVGLAAGIVIIVVVSLIIIISVYLVFRYSCFRRTTHYSTETPAKKTDANMNMRSIYKVKNGARVSSAENTGYNSENEYNAHGTKNGSSSL